MGRYVTSESDLVNYEHKFRFAEQSSNFGEVLEGAGLEHANITRYVSDCGEIVSLYVDDAKALKEELVNLSATFEADYDKEMIADLAEAIPDDIDSESVRFYVEY